MPKKAKLNKKARSVKEERLFQNLYKTIQQFIGGKAFSTMTEEEIFERLQLPGQHSDLFHEVLDTLIQQGVIICTNGLYTLKKADDSVVSGVLRAHPRGFGFVHPDNLELNPQDIFIPKHQMHNAVDGDQVEVEVNREVISEKGPEGKITAILSRTRTHVGGIIRDAKPGGEIIAYVPLLGASQPVVVKPTPGQVLREGDRVVMHVEDWGGKNRDTICTVSHSLGHISDASCDIRAAIEEFELRSDFPHHVVEEAKEFGSRVTAKDIKDREDLRDLLCFTIDPDTAKDFDDAISLEKDKQGNYYLGVHIADVSHYVRSGTALDEEARKRANSTYFPAYCLPMLPRELSDNLCSLKPKVNRLTASVFMDFDAHGNMTNYRIARTVINSAKRFSYREAKEVLDGKKKSPFLPSLKLMVEMCGLLKRKRHERGSVEFALPEVIIRVDENGVPQGTEYIEYDITHQLVEEFMLKTNETVAWHLCELGKNLTYRVHDVPSEENLKDFSLLAAAFGFRLSEKPTPAEIQKLFEEALETPYGPYLATSYIRRMRLAAYSAENIGHYGLGLEHYCHFTSPIRRYVDLVVHRILFGESDDRTAIEQIASHCSDRERISAKAESSVVLLKKLRFLDAMHQKDPRCQYEAVVTRIKPFGFFFETLDFMLEGFLHVSELDADYYVYDEGGMRLRGVHTGKGFQSGEKITVMLKDVDLIYQESRWSFVPDRSVPRKEIKETRKGFKEKKEVQEPARKTRAAEKPKTPAKQSASRRPFLPARSPAISKKEPKVALVSKKPARKPAKKGAPSTRRHPKNK